MGDGCEKAFEFVCFSLFKVFFDIKNISSANNRFY